MRRLVADRRIQLILLAVVVAVVLVVVTAYNRLQSKPSGFIVLRNAESVEYVTFLGTKQMRYEMDEPYPAKTALKSISDQLDRRGWKPLQNSYLQPDRPSSHVTGWDKFQDGRKTPWVHVRQWMAEWTNSKGDVLMYALRYEWPNDGPPNTSRARLNSVLIPAKAAKAVMSQRAELLKSGGGGSAD